MSSASETGPAENRKGMRLNGTPLNRDGLVEKIAGRIRTAIFEQQLKPGDRILEQELSRELNVSRTPIREALRWLEREGLVRREPYRGACVSFMSEEEIRNTFRIRAVLESMAVENARKRATPDDIEILRKRIDGMRRAASKRDLSAFNVEDMEFHQYIWQISGDRVLENVLNFLCRQAFMAYNSQTLALMDRRELDSLVETHTEFLRILEDGSGPAAGRVRAIQNSWLDTMLARAFRPQPEAGSNGSPKRGQRRATKRA